MPVVHYRPRYLALSTEHPMHCGWDPHALLKEADLVLVVDCDVPWIPKEGGPRAEAKVIHIGPDPLFARYPLRGFRTDIALTGAVAGTLQALCACRAEACGLSEPDRGAPQSRGEKIGRDPSEGAAAATSRCPRASPASGCRPA